VAKVLAFINEFNDPAAAGDDFGMLIPRAVMPILSSVTLFRTRTRLAFLETPPAKG
jgi:hypothetical protein